MSYRYGDMWNIGELVLVRFHGDSLPSPVKIVGQGIKNGCKVYDLEMLDKNATYKHRWCYPDQIIREYS